MNPNRHTGLRSRIMRAVETEMQRMENVQKEGLPLTLDDCRKIEVLTRAQRAMEIQQKRAAELPPELPTLNSAQLMQKLRKMPVEIPAEELRGDQPNEEP